MSLTALSEHSPAGPTLQNSLPEPIIHPGRSIMNDPMGVDVFDFRRVSLCEIDDRANGLHVNLMWGVLEPGCDLE
jgi:hypothetical protein